MKDFKDIITHITSSQEVYINFENETIEGSVLDVGMDNKGIIYNLCKNNDDSINIDYFKDDGYEKVQIEQLHDNIVMFFALGRLGFETERKKLMKEMVRYLKDGGNIIIWDLDKRRGQSLNMNINVILPGKATKRINIRDYNLLRDTSAERIKKLISPYFDIIEFTLKDNVYYIKGLKKGSAKDETIAGSG